MISDQALQEFKIIRRDETGQEISDKEALDTAVALLHLFGTILPMRTSQSYPKIQQCHNWRAVWDDVRTKLMEKPPLLDPI